MTATGNDGWAFGKTLGYCIGLVAACAALLLVTMGALCVLGCVAVVLLPVIIPVAITIVYWPG
jgi:hypothetical protein